MNVQLIQTSDQTHLFAKRYDAPLHGIFDMQESVAQAIAAHVPETTDKIHPRYRTASPAVRKSKADLIAYNYCLLSRQQIQQCTPTPLAAMAKSRQYCEDAIARDPEFALGFSALAEWYWWHGFLGLKRPKEAFAAGTRAALRAIELDPSLGLPHALLGTFRCRLDYDWAEAALEMALALQLEPANPEIRFRYAEGYLLPQGRFKEAVAELERALESDPLSAFYHFWLGYAFYLGREYVRALKEFQFLIDLAPDRHLELIRASDIAYFGVGLVRLIDGRFDEAVSAFRKAVELSNGQLPVRLGLLGSALACNGNIAEARRLLEDAEATAAASYFPALSVAMIYLWLGDVDAAFAWMQRAVGERDPNVVGINTYPMLVPLHADPRFTALLHKMNLKP